MFGTAGLAAWLRTRYPEATVVVGRDADNGYKVHMAGGAQLVASYDRDIETTIAAIGPAARVPRSPVPPADHVRNILLSGYLDRVPSIPRTEARDLRIALTRCAASR